MNLKISKKEEGIFDIVVDGEIVGGGYMQEHEDGELQLDRIDIDEQHRNKGIGTAALYELSKAYGSYFMTADNEDAARLYERIADEISDRDYDAWGFAIDMGYGVYEM